MVIGDIYTRDEIDSYKKENKITGIAISATHFTVGDLRFKKLEDGRYMLESTRESRIANQSSVNIRRNDSALAAKFNG